MCPTRTIFPLILPLASDGRQAEAVDQSFADVAILEAFGHAEGGERPRRDERRTVRGRGANAGLAGLAHDAMPVPRIFDPSSLISRNAVRTRRIKVWAGVYGVSNCFIFLRADFKLK